ncbi:MAG: hypothetical protein KBE09_00770 [Candidatus Pacebacteria bacterium]|nr:hypothetical protein [Candidatus Paceibacterota bacterium]
MLYLFLGSDAHQRATAFFKQKAPQARVERLLADTVGPEHLTDYFGASLFGEVRVVLLEGFFGTAALRDVVEGSLETLASSEEHFAIIEESLLAPQKKKIAAHTKHLDEKQKAKVDRPMGSFTVAEHFARHERSLAWVAYRKSLAEGESAEALHGILFWKVKDTLLKGVKDSKRDLRKTLQDLAELPLRAREKGGDVEHALERFILER